MDRLLLLSCVALLVMLAVVPTASAMSVDGGAVSARACTIMGTAGANRLDGTAKRDAICGLGGADELRGNGAADVLRGGGGADLLQGKAGADRLDGNAGDDQAYGGAGADRLRGGRGDDGLGGGLGPDDLAGGPGRDVVFYGQRGGPVRVSIGKGANDGVRGEHDNVLGDVEDVRGGRGGDVLIGNDAGNELFGAGGRDRLVGRGGSDMLEGGDGNDRIDARESAGATGSAAQAGSPDRVVCGGGEDTALVDPQDIVEGCEHIVGAQRSPVNHPPTGVALSDASVAENEPVGTAVGTLTASDPDPGDRPSFALVPGAGSTDNSRFEIVGSQLRTREVFDYEAARTYSVRIRAVDHGTPAGQIVRAFTITVSDVNEAPTGLTLTPPNPTRPENEPVGTAVGDFSVTDDDAGQSHAFALVPGAGGADNGKFSITGSTLEIAQVLDFEAQQSYSIRVRATDDGTPAQSVEDTFTITVTDTAEPPLPDAESATTPEDTPATITLSATDPEGDDVTQFVTSAPSHGTPGAVGPITCTGTPNLCTATVDFTPDPNYNGPAGFSYTAGDGTHVSAPAAVSITVDPVNDTPIANSGSRRTNEDTPLTLNLDALVSDVETSDANLTYEIVTPPAHGTATATTYTPTGDFNGTDSFTYRVTDRGDPDNCGAPGPGCDGPETSTTETVSITVDPVNDTPNASDASPTTTEDTSLTLNLDALVSDVETSDANLTYEIVTPPAHGTATPTTYTPAGDFNGSDSFTYRVTDRGDPDNCGAPGPGCDGPETSSTQTVSITVDAVNDAPVNFLPAGPVTAVEDTDTPIAGLSVADVDAGGDDVQLTLSALQGTLTVSTSVVGGVGTLQVAGNGTKTVVVRASLAQIDVTLANANGLVYHGDAAYTGPDTLTMATDDLGHTGAGGPLTDTDTLAITVEPPNATPVADAQSVSTDEDTPKAITLSASDADGDPLTFAIATGAGHGALGPIGPVTCGVTPNVCTASITYTPDGNFSGPDSFSFTADDGRATSAAATVSITVNPVNDDPSLANIEAGALAYTENDPATLVTATTTVSDVDSANFDTGTLTVDYSVGGTADDRLEIVNQGQIAVSGSDVSFGGTTIGSFTGGTGMTPLVVTLNANATSAATEALVRAVAFRNVSDAPSSAARTVRLVLTDGDGGTSAPATRALNLTAVNDAPALAGIEATALAYTENDPATAITGTLTVSDPDSNLTGATVRISANLAPAEDVLAFVNTPQITGNYVAATGTLTLTGSATAAAYQSALRTVTYRNSSENPSTATRTISFQADDGPNPSNQSNTLSRDVSVAAVNDAPVADDETFNAANSAVGNTTLIGNDASDGPPSLSSPKKTISADILAGDIDAEGQTLVVQPVTDQATTDGGRVTIEADGDFVYTPAAGTSCTDHSDSFNYTVSDQNAAGPGPTPGTDTGTVTIATAGCVWYVNNTATGNGISSAPFATLAQAETASSANDTVFVFDGDNTSTGYGGDGYAMNAGERLIGEHEGLVVGSDTLHPANPGAKPTLTATGADVIDLNTGNEIRGFVIDPSGAGGGIAGSTGDTGATIGDVDIADTATAGTQAGLELNGTTGTFNISNLTVNNQATGVLLNNAGTVNFAPTGTISITSAGAPGLSATGTGLGTSTFDSITVTGSGTGGVSLTNTTGTTTFGDLALTTTSGATPAFGVSNGGTVSVPPAGTDNLNATGGPAVDVTGTSGAALSFDAVSSTNSANDGINLAGLGTGTFSAASGAITGAAGIAFDLDGGSGAVTYPGTIGNGTGESAEITNRSGGTVTLSGAITDTSDAGGGINLSTNTGATINFTGDMTLSTGASTAFNATAGGTVSATGTASTLTTTTGAALNVGNTSIGASDLNFRSIASNGAASGIVLNSTGAAGGLTVTGNGGTCSSAATCTGGAIQSSTGPGINLTSVGGGVSLTSMSVNSGGDDGIRGSSVTGLSLATSVVLNNGNAVGERGIDITELSGSGGLATTTVSGSSESNVVISNDTSNLAAFNVTGSTIANTNMTTGDDGILVLNTGSAAMTVSVTGSTFTDNKGDHFQAASDASSTGSVDVTFDNNTLTTTAANDPNVVGGGITLNPGSANDLSFKVRNNNIQQAFDDAINLNLDPSSTAAGSLIGTVSGNTIGTAGQAGSGSESSNTITLRAAGAGLARVAIQNNTIREWTNAMGISIATAEGTADIDATVTGNSVKNPDPTLGLNGIRFDAGATAGPPIDDGVICAAVTGNDATGTGVAGAADIRLRQRFNTTIRVPGYGGAIDNDAAVEAFVAANNTGNPVVDATNNVAGGGGGFPGGAACTLPPP